MPTAFECTIPILAVKSVTASIDFYVNKLGFRVDWGGEDGAVMASVSRDGHAIMLCGEGQGHPGTWVWIGVEDVESLMNEWEGLGVEIMQAPTNYPWAYEMRVKDPEGHVLRVGSDSRKDKPLVT